MSTNPFSSHNYLNGYPMKSLKINTSLVTATAILAFSVPYFAHGTGTPSKDAIKTEQTATVADMTDGEIRKVDKDSKKITIKHAEIKNLDMPAMTMVFQVKDPAMLDKVQSGDKVKFKVIKTDSGFVVTDLQIGK